MSRPTGNTPFPERARTLAPKQYGLHEDPVRPSEPIPVRVWLVTVRGDEFETDAVALAWTRRAVNVEYIDKHGRRDSAWVWAGAVTRRPPASTLPTVSG
ncbi:hypothetical protein Xcel_3470 (plasmid) [Xylanimonas cellulosilytica DSM 15894]|uniref:Uncharacterized protein n=1 Tax=Xylanimonas cellulosilytica (strain DSM 15894 / JCM 12276 / CECT 5975 / KCTC 9989 / LMG 20990 / NBRC 107835 / XIL07) TaxID=446471 RepID=D1C103_XYLCX|nr:hypothetical protein [Xylanimonas cellulosilytica]ACZ32469.1 hypothetical protein Xcel_3470 [Xylanimonas cellulosilytica DSM 15894]